MSATFERWPPTLTTSSSGERDRPPERHRAYLSIHITGHVIAGTEQIGARVRRRPFDGALRYLALGS